MEVARRVVKIDTKRLKVSCEVFSPENSSAELDEDEEDNEIIEGRLLGILIDCSYQLAALIHQFIYPQDIIKNNIVNNTQVVGFLATV